MSTATAAPMFIGSDRLILGGALMVALYGVIATAFWWG